MTLPLLLLGLYLGLLIVAISLASWAGHMSPAPDEARRVTDAAERAGLSHLGPPARIAAVLTLVFTGGSGALAVSRELPLSWFLLAPLLAPPVIGLGLFYCALKLQRTAGQLVGAVSADAQVTLTSRATVAAVLFCDSTIGLVLLGVYSLAAGELGSENARVLVWMMGSSLALSAVVFARATAVAQYAASCGVGEDDPAPHAGSLALLVTTTFHSPLLRLLSLVLLSTLGHCALLAMDPGTAPAEEGGVVLWLYPHLLKLLGLFALLFAGLTVRTSEEETGSESWYRGAIVYLVLMVAGAWSLSSELPVGWSRTVPAGLTFLYVALGLSVWFGRGDLRASPRAAIMDSAFAKLPATWIFWGLVVVLVVSTTLAPTEDPLPAQALLSLLLAGALAVAPISLVWLLARDLARGGSAAGTLAFAGNAPRGRVPAAPPLRLLSVLPLLSLIVGLSALAGSLPDDTKVSGLLFALLGVGAGLGALTMGALLGSMERAAARTIDAISDLIRSSRASNTESTVIDFESAVVLCRDAIVRSNISWLLLSIAPTALALVALPLLPAEIFRFLILGLSTGSLLLSIGLELLLNSHPHPTRAALANLSLVIGLTQVLWLLTSGNPHSP